MFIGFREIEPVGSRAVTASFSYVFSPKYAVTASVLYDFGTSQTQSTTLMLTRIGTDIQMSFGVSYNAMQNSFGVLFEVLPNLVAQSRAGHAMTGVSAAGVAGSANNPGH